MTEKEYRPRWCRPNPITEFLFQNVIGDIVETIAVTALMSIVLMGSVSLIYGIISIPFSQSVELED